MTRYEGSFKWFNNERGYGFISPDEKGPTAGRDVFILYSQYKEFHLDAGDRVSYELIANGHKGLKAANIRPLRGVQRVKDETEEAYAARLAAAILDDATRDPDGEASVLARQLLRAQERVAQENAGRNVLIDGHLQAHGELVSRMAKGA